MSYRIYLQRITISVFLLIFSTLFCFGQGGKPSGFYENKLLNGLKLYVSTEPNEEKVIIKLRVHSGSAFDPKDKMGVMAMLADILFPTEQSRQYFSEDLEGSLDIITTYDYIQITATGKSSEVLAMIETIANTVVNPQITPENFTLVKATRLQKIKELEQNPSYLADRAVAKKLLGEFPYGRTSEGTEESLAKIDYADLLFAKDRFLTSDNATVTISGNIKPDFVYRATRQLFGNWTKADKKVPATFAMANEPNTTPQTIDFTPIDSNIIATNEFRFATRGIARNDKDYWAMRFLAEVLQNRIRAKVSPELQSKISVVNERNLLPSYISFKLSLPPANLEASTEVGVGVLDFVNGFGPKTWFAEPISAAELEQTRTKIISEISQKSMVDKVLDVITFRLVSVNDEIQKLNSVKQTDLQRMADKLAKQTFVSVTLNSSANKQ